MTLKELLMTLENRKKGLAYILWKSGSLNQWLKEYPETPETASPELYPPPPTIKKPDFLKNTKYKKKGDEFIYE